MMKPGKQNRGQACDSCDFRSRQT